MHLLSFPISLELKGRTLTATLTEAPAMMRVGAKGSRRAEDLCGYRHTHLEPAQVEDERNLSAMHEYTCCSRDKMFYCSPVCVLSDVV